MITSWCYGKDRKISIRKKAGCAYSHTRRVYPLNLPVRTASPGSTPGLRGCAAEQLLIVSSEAAQVPEAVVRGDLSVGQPVAGPDNGRTHLVQPHEAQKSPETDTELLLEGQLESPPAGMQSIAEAREREHLVRLRLDQGFGGQRQGASFGGCADRSQRGIVFGGAQRGAGGHDQIVDYQAPHSRIRQRRRVDR